jgi:hypothetical protein
MQRSCINECASTTMRQRSRKDRRAAIARWSSVAADSAAETSTATAKQKRGANFRAVARGRLEQTTAAKW